MRRLLVISSMLVVWLTGCLDPLVEDELVRQNAILAPGTEVPSSEDNPTLAAQIRENDFVQGDVVPLLSGFSDGKSVSYWDFGTAPDIAQPMYVLVGRADDGPFAVPEGTFAPVGHPPVWNVIPGDAAYSPFWQVILAPVTDDYAGEVLPSFDAVEQAIASGLIERPIPTGMVVNCPVVPRDSKLELPDGSLRETGTAYCRGYQVYYHDVGVVPLDAYERIDVGEVYRLRREGGEPLDEVVRAVDMTGDGDAHDTNNIFRFPEAHTHLFRIVDVVTQPEYGSIDTTADQTSADAESYDDLFESDGVADPDQVVAVYPTSSICNCPLAPTE